MKPVAEIRHGTRRFGLFPANDNGAPVAFRVWERDGVIKREELEGCIVLHLGQLWHMATDWAEVPAEVKAFFEQVLIQRRAATPQEPPACP